MSQANRSPFRPWLLAVLLVLLAVWGVRSGRLAWPDRWNPWAPLRIDEAPNALTRFKLARAAADDAACRRALGQAAMRLTPVQDRVTGEGCGFENAVRIERSSVEVGEPFTLSCRAALSLAMWERHALQQAARRHLGREVVGIEHYGSYACRNLYGETGRRRSRHATADALDVSGFVLDDGRRVRVSADWRPGAGPPADPPPTRGSAQPSTDATPESRFLREVRDGACRYFDIVLGPDYDRAHADHFHLDRGGGRLCR